MRILALMNGTTFDTLKAGQGELATKADIQALKSNIQNLEKRLEDKISNLRWTVIVVAGVVVALIKFLPV